ncbi:MAG: gamma-glutamyl-gamma-aminobutyrate hydrolase family protein, partial [Pseudomonadota bacterium]
LLGTLNPLLKTAGFRMRYVNFGRHPDAEPRLDGYDCLIVLGGPMNVGQVDEYPHLATEMRLIAEALDRGMPVLGICLGAQLMAAALGANVQANPAPEIGWYDVTPTEHGESDPLLAQFRNPEPIFQWHGDTFDIPPGAVHLAASDTCPNQAFRVGERSYGLQFHLEVDAPLVERWLTVPLHVEELRRHRFDAERIREATRANIDASMDLSTRTFGAFIELVGRPSRRRLLRSR